MFLEKSVGKHAFFLLIDRIKGEEGWYILYIGAEEVLQYYIQAEGGIAGLAGIVEVAGFVSVAGIAGIIHRNKKKVWLFSNFSTFTYLSLRRPSVPRGECLPFRP